MGRQEAPQPLFPHSLHPLGYISSGGYGSGSSPSTQNNSTPPTYTSPPINTVIMVIYSSQISYNLCNSPMVFSQGSVVSAIGGIINTIISAIANIIMTIVGAIVTVSHIAGMSVHSTYSRLPGHRCNLRPDCRYPLLPNLFFTQKGRNSAIRSIQLRIPTGYRQILNLSTHLPPTAIRYTTY